MEKFPLEKLGIYKRFIDNVILRPQFHLNTMSIKLDVNPYLHEWNTYFTEWNLQFHWRFKKKQHLNN